MMFVFWGVVMPFIFGMVLGIRSVHVKRGAYYAKEWRDMGRKWAIVGEAEKSNRCHALADWWELPWHVAIMAKRPRV